MLQRYAIIVAGRVDNLTRAEADYATGKGWIQSDTANIGDLWDGGHFTSPSEPQLVVPQQITRAQGKAALIGAELWPAALAYVAAIPDDTQRALAEVALHDTLEWRRDSPFLSACAAGLGLTAEQLDALFIDAAEILL